MSEASRDARRAMRAKAHRLTTQTLGKVDASDYGGEETENADVQTGMRPVSRRAYKKGGKVTGKDAPKNAGKKPRKSPDGSIANFADALVNRDVKMANEDRAGIKHIGGMKTGGRAERASGGEAAMKMGQMSGLGNFDKPFKKGGRVKKNFGGRLSEVAKDGMFGLPGKLGYLVFGKDSNTGENEDTPAKKSGGRIAKKGGGLLGGLAQSGMLGLAGLGANALFNGQNDDDGTPKKRGGSIDNGERPKGGRIAKTKGGDVGDMLCNKGGRVGRKSGGRTGKTDINIIISAAPKPETPPMMPPPDAPMGGPPIALPPHAGMPPAGPPQMPPPPVQNMPPPMPRKSGGRTMRAGAGSGLGRLEKTEIAKRTYKP